MPRSLAQFDPNSGPNSQCPVHKHVTAFSHRPVLQEHDPVQLEPRRRPHPDQQVAAHVLVHVVVHENSNEWTRRRRRRWRRRWFRDCATGIGTATSNPDRSAEGTAVSTAATSSTRPCALCTPRPRANLRGGVDVRPCQPPRGWVEDDVRLLAPLALDAMDRARGDAVLVSQERLGGATGRQACQAGGRAGGRAGEMQGRTR